MKPGSYSSFWLVDRGQLSSPAWKHKPHEPFTLPTSAELEQYAQLPFVERQALEQREAGEVFTWRPDAHDARAARQSKRRGAK